MKTALFITAMYISNYYSAISTHSVSVRGGPHMFMHKPWWWQCIASGICSLSSQPPTPGIVVAASTFLSIAGCSTNLMYIDLLTSSDPLVRNVLHTARGPWQLLLILTYLQALTGSWQIFRTCKLWLACDKAYIHRPICKLWLARDKSYVYWPICKLRLAHDRSYVYRPICKQWMARNKSYVHCPTFTNSE